MFGGTGRGAGRAPDGGRPGCPQAEVGVPTSAEKADLSISRRRALTLGGGLLASAFGVGAIAASPAWADDHGRGGDAGPGKGKEKGHDGGGKGGSQGSLPVQQMEDALQAQGTVTDGVLVVGIDRKDIDNVTLHGVPIYPSFEVNGDLCFQPIGDNLAFFNGDMALKPDEVNPVIDAILANGLVFQAEHQHFYDFNPPVWFIHFRGQGEPVDLAKRVHNVVKATSTPLPQAPPSNPSTPFDKDRLQSILHGYDAEVGDDGVVTVFVARKDPIYIEGILVKPETNIATNVAFEPLDSSGSQAAAAPDFAMEADEINRVMAVMRQQGWDIGCLYNQETDESPQLFFSHQFKTGDPYQLAAEIRKGLDQTNSQ